jgi:hypothetical protein
MLLTLLQYMYTGVYATCFSRIGPSSDNTFLKESTELCTWSDSIHLGTSSLLLLLHSLNSDIVGQFYRMILFLSYIAAVLASHWVCRCLSCVYLVQGTQNNTDPGPQMPLDTKIDWPTDRQS